MTESAGTLPDSWRLLGTEELAQLPDCLFDQAVAAPLRSGEHWLILSAESPATPSPQTRRLEAAIGRLGHKPLIVHGSRFKVQSCLKAYGGEVQDDSDLFAPVETALPSARLSETSTARLVGDLVEYAVESRASDIHLECRRDSGTRVRFRRDGRLFEGPIPLSNQRAEAVAHYLFSLGRRGNRHWQPNAPCDGVVDVPGQDGADAIQLRLASLPEVRGWDLVARLFSTSNDSLDLASIGYSDAQVDTIREICHRPYGAILFSGPTGSGKSTSMLAALAELPDWVKVVALEQPVERTLPNASHMTVGLADDLPAAAPALNRCDADIAVLGELRDAAGASVLCDFVTAGKLTLATVHAARAHSIPLRLTELGVDASLVGDPGFLIALVNQRLIPRLCPSCRLPLTGRVDRLPNWCRRHFERPDSDISQGIFVRGSGCSDCIGGCRGRILTAEVLQLDETDHHLLAAGDYRGWHRLLDEKLQPNLQQQGMKAVRSGLADPVDVSRIIGLGTADIRPVHHLHPAMRSALA